MLKGFFVALIVYLILDAFWLGVFMKGFYFRTLGDLARKEGDSLRPNILASIITYIILAIGMAVIVFPNVHSLDKAILYGVVFGIVAYGVYDMTNMAILKGWTWKLSIIDLAWGILASTIVSVLGTYILKYWK